MTTRGGFRAMEVMTVIGDSNKEMFVILPIYRITSLVLLESWFVRNSTKYIPGGSNPG